ncbi:MAG: M28 family peptidase [Thermoanaerobaculia bacterium]
MRCLPILLTFVVAIAAPLFGADSVESASQAITESYVRGATEFLADDLLEGRGPGTRGDALARTYIASELRKLGMAPGAHDGTFDQKFEMVGIDTSAPAGWTFVASGASRDLTLKHYDEYIGSAGKQQAATKIANAELVFVGYGIQAPEFKWDDFKGVDLRGKVLVMMNSDPDWDSRLFGGTRRMYYGRWNYKYESAARQGAAGAIIIHTTPSAGYPWQVVQTSWSGPQFELPAGDEPRIELAAWVTEDAARRLVALGGRQLDSLIASAKNRDFRPVPLGITTSFDATNTLTRIVSGNVIGLLPGSDPDLADEVVIYTAHHDHLGLGKPDASGDTIYNGALDNATGVAQALGIARAYSLLAEKPRRSIMFLFVAAEEQGLLGSEYYTKNPTFPPGKIAATVNFDGANVWGRTKDIALIGYGKSTLDAVAVEAAASQRRTVKPEQMADRGYYYRSDQFSFAKIGVPSLYFDSGSEYANKPLSYAKEVVEAYERVRYHQPNDEVDPAWDYSGVVDDARIGFLSGLRIANDPVMPSWNRGDEFEHAREEAVEKAK